MEAPLLNGYVFPLLHRLSNFYVEVSSMIIVFKEDYVRRLFVNVENELTQVMRLALWHVCGTPRLDRLKLGCGVPRAGAGKILPRAA